MTFIGELASAQALLRAYESGDDAEVQRALGSGVIRAMDNAYLRILKNIHTTELGEAATNAGGGEIDDDDDLR